MWLFIGRIMECYNISNIETKDVSIKGKEKVKQ